ncbi:hypothetical protein D3C81_1786220 [compost metagenome]
MDIAVANFAIEFLVLEHRAAFLVQSGSQVTIGGVWWSIRQQHAGKGIQVTQAVAGEFKPQIQPAKVHRVGQRPRHHHPSGTGAYVGLQREWHLGILQRQHAANLATAR